MLPSTQHPTSLQSSHVAQHPSTQHPTYLSHYKYHRKISATFSHSTPTSSILHQPLNTLHQPLHILHQPLNILHQPLHNRLKQSITFSIVNLLIRHLCHPFTLYTELYTFNYHLHHHLTHSITISLSTSPFLHSHDCTSSLPSSSAPK